MEPTPHANPQLLAASILNEAITTTTTQYAEKQRRGRPRRTAKYGIGLVVVVSMAAGLITAAVLVAIPLVPAKENVLTGVVLLAFAL